MFQMGKYIVNYNYTYGSHKPYYMDNNFFNVNSS
jgi:hypothetical protein